MLDDDVEFVVGLFKIVVFLVPAIHRAFHAVFAVDLDRAVRRAIACRIRLEAGGPQRHERTVDDCAVGARVVQVVELECALTVHVMASDIRRRLEHLLLAADVRVFLLGRSRAHDLLLGEVGRFGAFIVDVVETIAKHHGTRIHRVVDDHVALHRRCASRLFLETAFAPVNRIVARIVNPEFVLLLGVSVGFKRQHG